MANLGYSPKRYEILKKVSEAGRNSKKQVGSKCGNSEFLMEEFLVKNKGSIILALLKLKIDGRTYEDWEYAEGYCHASMMEI